MKGLSQRRCKPCEGGTEPLSRTRIEILLPQVSAWRLSIDQRAISRRFSFRGFNRVMGFVNAMAWVAHHQGHHPDFSAGSDYCDVTYSTHAIGGLSENDFICAARLDELVDD
jgi:4a-hydroxytetrahydrobiopterin dehydratase